MADVVDTPLSELLFDGNWDLARRRILFHPEDISRDEYNEYNLRLACDGLFMDIPIDVLELMLKHDRSLFEEKKVEKLAACSAGGDLATSPLITCMLEHGQGLGVEKVREAVELFIKYAPESLLETSSKDFMDGLTAYEGSLEGFGIMHYMVLDMPLWNVQGELRTSELQKEHMAMWKLLVDAKPNLLLGNPALLQGQNETPFQFAVSFVPDHIAMSPFVRDEAKEKALMYELYETLLPLRQVGGGNLLHRFAAFSKTTQKQLESLFIHLPTLGSTSMLEQQDADGNTPLHVALLSNRIGITPLLRSSESMNVANKKGEFPLDLYLAAKCGQDVMVDVVNSFPSAFNRLPICDSLYPFLFAKLKPNTVYELLKPALSLALSGPQQQVAGVKRKARGF